MEKLKYPIGKAIIPRIIKQENIDVWLKTLEIFPSKIELLVVNLYEEQLNTPYRKEGWTIRQVIHHCADSHHNSYTRFKWALTEDNPIIKPYYEQKWAEFFDYKTAPITMSILHLKAIHAKLVYLLNGLSEIDLNRTFVHPDNNETITLKENIGIYAWHCDHHYAHINNLLISKKWK